MPLAVPLHAIAISVVIHSLWGGNPIAVKFGLLAFPPLWSALLRFAIGAVCVITWARLRGVRVWPLPGEWPVLAVIAALFTVQIGLMNTGFDRTSGAMGSVLIATNPLFAALFAHLLIRGDRLTWVRSAGLALAMIGAVVCLLQDADLGAMDFGATGNWIVLASACLLGLRLSLSARVLRSMHEARVVIWQMLLSMPLFAAGALAFETVAWERVSWPAVAGIVYQGVVIAGLGFTVAFALMKRYTPSVMMSFNFVSPVAGVVLAAWLLDERVTPLLLAGMALVAAGLALVTRRGGA
jgi:drug/metabolite transporter (DMT)-like permease